VDFKAGTLTVSPKPDFTPKDWEQRTIEVDDTENRGDSEGC